MRRLYIYLTPQKFDSCVLTRKDIARTYGDMIHYLEFNDKNNQKDPDSIWVTASYCFPMLDEDLFDECYVVYPNGDMDRIHTLKDYDGVFQSFKEIGKQIMSRGPDSVIGPGKQVASSYMQWEVDFKFQGRDEELEENFKDTIKNLRENAKPNPDILTDLDVVKMVLVNAGMSEPLDIQQVIFNGQELQEEKDINDVVSVLSRVIVKNTGSTHILPNQINLSDMERYSYTLFFKNGWRYERDLNGIQVYHNDELQLEVE